MNLFSARTGNLYLPQCQHDEIVIFHRFTPLEFILCMHCGIEFFPSDNKHEQLKYVGFVQELELEMARKSNES